MKMLACMSFKAHAQQCIDISLGQQCNNRFYTAFIDMQEQHAEMLAAVLKLRLRADGKALIALAVRDEVTLIAGSAICMSQ